MSRGWSSYDVVLAAPFMLSAKVLADDVFHYQLSHDWRPALGAAALQLLKITPPVAGNAQALGLYDWFASQPLFATMFGAAIIISTAFAILVKRPGASR